MKNWWSWLFFPFSPTLLIIQILKNYFSNYNRTNIQRAWSGFFIFYAFCIVVATAINETPLEATPNGGKLAIVALALSRIFEVMHGFYRDAIDRFNRDDPRTSMGGVERLNWLGFSYLEVICNFALIYWLLTKMMSEELFKRNIDGMMDAFYFSAITITSTGYGDIAPSHALTKGLVALEVLSGTLLIVLVLASYVSFIGGDNAKKN